jgi:hypothetical protein
VKVIAQLLPSLPIGPSYRVVFMRRDLDEVLRSQRVMLARRGSPAAACEDGFANGEMRRTLIGHIAETEDWLRARAGTAVLYVSYNRLLSEPRRQMERVSRFLGGDLDLDAMAAVVEPSLYRQRPPGSR